MLSAQTSAPSGSEKRSDAQREKTSAATTTRPSAVPSRGWSAQPGAARLVTVQPPVGSPLAEVATRTLSPSIVVIDANQRPDCVS